MIELAGWRLVLGASLFSSSTMNPEKQHLLSLEILPARLNAVETSWYLGFHEADIRVLVAAGLLKPLGRPSQTAQKYFALIVLQQLRSDVKWLARATDAVQGHWRRKNGNKSKGPKPSTDRPGGPSPRKPGGNGAPPKRRLTDEEQDPDNSPET